MSKNTNHQKRILCRDCGNHYAEELDTRCSQCWKEFTGETEMPTEW